MKSHSVQLSYYILFYNRQKKTSAIYHENIILVENLYFLQNKVPTASIFFGVQDKFESVWTDYHTVYTKRISALWGGLKYK